MNHRPTSLPTLIRTLAAGAPKTLAGTTQIHAQLLLHSLLSPFHATKLLHLYSPHPSALPAVLRLFQSVIRPNLFAWTALLAALSRSHHHRLTLSSYSLMRAAAISPDAYVLAIALRSAAAGHLSVPAALHADAIKFAAADNLHVINALIFAYSTDPAAARAVFCTAAARDLLTYNTLISAYATATATTGFMDQAADIVQSMKLDGCEPDIVTWNTMMDGYCRTGRISEALQIFAQISTPNVVSWTTIILGHSRVGNHEEALNLFSRMIMDGLVAPDQDLLSCVLSSCRQVADSCHRFEVHAYGIKLLGSDTFYSSTGAALVATYLRRGRIRAARHVFDKMDPTDSVTWNAMMVGLVQADMNDDALEYFRTMQFQGVRCDGTTIATVLQTCELRLGREVHAHVIRNCDNATMAWNALISMYSRAGCIETAHLMFSLMGARDVVTWNTMIGAFGLHGMGGSAVELVKEMGKCGVRPNLVTFTSAITACSHAGMVEKGLELFEGMGVVVGMEQYSCVVDMLGRSGRFKEALSFISRMPMRADGRVWGALLAAASRCRHEGVEYGRVAFEELARVEPWNAGNYVTMANIYANVGRWKEAKEVRELMEMRGLVKPFGHSWIRGGQTNLKVIMTTE